ncbi:MAG: ABC transporter substrate-binding protein [Anaerolineae bacterium]
MSIERERVTRHIFWQVVLATLGIVLVFLVLFQLVADEPPPPVVEEATVEVPVQGGVYVEGVLGYLGVMNPILAPRMVQANPVDQDLSALVFDGLTSLDASGRISPSLALEWQVSDDGAVYEFRLRPGVTWHDGAPLTSADVAFTIQSIQDPGYQGDPSLAELWRTVRVETPDAETVRFELAEPFPSFINYTTIGLLPAHLLGNVPADELPEHEFSTAAPVGTGMFQVESVSPDRVVLAANQDYWGPRPFLEGIEFWFYADWEGLLADYEQGDIHGFRPPTVSDLPALAAMPTLQLYSAQSAGYGIVFLNLARETLPFFGEQEVRQGLLYALDRQKIIDDVLLGRGLVAHNPIAPMSWAYDPSVRQYGYDPERAIGLLDASGWMDTDADRIRDKEQVPLAFALLTADDPTLVAMAQEMAVQWRAVGVDVTVVTASSEQVNQAVRERDYDAALVQVDLTADPDPYPLWHSTQAESGQNFSGYASEEADVVMEEIRSTTDPEELTRLYHTFQHTFAEEVPSLLIYYPIYTYAVDSRVQDVQLSPLFYPSDRFRNIEDWYIETEAVVVTDENDLDKTNE